MLDLSSIFLFPLFLIFARLGACIMVYPGLSDISISVRIRLLLAVFCSLAMFPILEPSMPLLPASNLKLLEFVLIEMAIGVMMATSARLFMAAMHVAGELVSFSAGLQASNLFDPSLGGNSTAPSLLLTMMATLLVFVTNLHHVMLLAVMESYNMFPAGGLPLLGDAAKAVTQVVSNLFLIGFKLAAPVVAVGFLIYAGLGVFNRLIPQLQVFFVAMPLTIVVGLLMLGIVLGGIVTLFTQELHNHAVLFTQE
ncbi:MAG: flagellar biosynthetic protein FliR [Magnetococcales bacterium]|nr:flagellar biosynthetic protein FliR [Magnetococcales bacterium]|tara:strand:+ start:2645 stop:3403 length:759 start_codon:yes stop_codon:yes gene_type:complete